MMRAENSAHQGFQLRLRQVPYEKRLRYYGEACRYFLQSYQHDPRVFTLSRIEAAVDACMRVRDDSSEEVFRRFEEQYAKEHPNEVRYGDAMPVWGLE